jgi:hypothetical protein
MKTEKTLDEQLKEVLEYKKRLLFFVAGMKWGARQNGSNLIEVIDAPDFDDFNNKYNKEDYEKNE